MDQQKRRRLLSAQVDRAPGPGALARAALLVAMAEDPELDARGCLRRLDVLSARVRAVIEDEGLLPWRALALVLGEEEGFLGDMDEYDAPRNSYLHQVLDTRRGLPILLSIVWVEVARGAGIRADGIGLPGHFIAAVGEGDRRQLVDPFLGGRPLSRQEALQRAAQALGDPELDDPIWLEPVDIPTTITRVLVNLLAAYERRGDVTRVIRTLDDLCTIEPNEVRHYVRRGSARAKAGDRAGALSDLNLALAMIDAGPAFERVASTARHIVRAVESFN